MIWFRYWPLLAVLIGMYWRESAWAAILLYHVGLVAGIWVRKEALREVRWKSPILVCGFAAVLGIAAYPAVRIGLPILVDPESLAQLGPKMEQLGLAGGSLVAFVVYFAIVHPVLEEIGWRGALNESSPRPHHHDLEFTAYHLPVLWWLFPGQWALLAISVLTLVGSAWMWRWGRDRYGLIAVIVFHAAADLGIVVAAVAVESRL